MKTWSCDSPDPESTHRMASLLGRSIGESGLVIGLVGPLGAGKTVFVKGLAEGLGIQTSVVSSPTFVIAQQYPIPDDNAAPHPFVLNHVDLYRLESEDELEAIGFSDLFESGSVVAIEWSDRFPDILGQERLEIELEGPSVEESTGAARGIRVCAYGTLAESVLEDWIENVERDKRGRAGSGGAEGMNVRPAQRTIGVLILALALSASAHFSSTPTDLRCVDPVSIEEDILGTLRVGCGLGAVGADSAGGLPTGVGGLLFGRPLILGTVSELQLEALPGIGPSRARAVIEARHKAPFERLEDLERVSGIGRKTVQAISAWVSVGDRDATICNGDTAAAGARGDCDHG